jgi:hypothetical protein
VYTFQGSTHAFDISEIKISKKFRYEITYQKQTIISRIFLEKTIVLEVEFKPTIPKNFSLPTELLIDFSFLKRIMDQTPLVQF